MIATEDRILNAATTVFAKRGITGATTREIAQKAKVNEVTLFRLFKNKEELLRRVVSCSSSRFADVFADAPLETTADLERTIEVCARVYMQKLIDNEELVRTFIGELNRNLELGRRLFAEGGKRTRLKFIAYLELARKKGLVRRDIDPTQTADCFSAMLMGGILRRPLTSAQYDFDDYVKICVKIYLKGIQP